MGVLTSSEELLYKDIKLVGDFTFLRIIQEAERQLGFKISLPKQPDNSGSQYYNQTINLKTLLQAINEYYQEENIKTNWKFSDRGILVYEQGSVKPPRPTVERKVIESKGPPYFSKPENEIESRPAKIIQLQAPAKQTPEIKNQTLTHEPKKMMVQPFPVKIEKAESKDEKDITVEPYPENATAFINDAPSILQQNIHEKFIEWQARMKGSLNLGNIEVLKAEKRELQKRLLWLNNNLPE